MLLKPYVVLRHSTFQGYGCPPFPWSEHLRFWGHVSPTTLTIQSFHESKHSRTIPENPFICVRIELEKAIGAQSFMI